MRLSRLGMVSILQFLISTCQFGFDRAARELLSNFVIGFPLIRMVMGTLSSLLGKCQKFGIVFIPFPVNP